MNPPARRKIITKIIAKIITKIITLARSYLARGQVSTKTWATAKTWLRAKARSWTRTLPLLRRYAQAQHGNRTALPRRLAVDVALLGIAVLLPFVILFWSSENEQQQLARLPLEQTTYNEGWQMSETRSYVFFDDRVPNSSEASSPEPSLGWSISCGRMYETASSRPPVRQAKLRKELQEEFMEEQLGERSFATKRLLCVEGAQVSTKGMTLTTESLAYEKGASGGRLTSDRPVSLREGAYRLSSLGGGIVDTGGDLRLFREILWQAPGLRISAQGEAHIKAVSAAGTGFLSEQERRVVVFKRDVAFAFEIGSKRYHGFAQRAELHPCSTAQRACRVFGNDRLGRVDLTGSVVFTESGAGVSALWTLQADRLVVKGEQARYKAAASGGSLDWVRIVLADGTQIRGRQGGHDLSLDEGLLCGDVEVRSSEGVLTAACLRYDLQKQRYSLESSASELELSERFFAL